MIRNLVLSGGAMKGMSFVGALQHLDELGVLSELKNIIGTSAGSIVAFLLCMNFTISEIRCTLIRFIQQYSKQEVNVDNLLNIYETLGIDNGSTLRSMLAHALFTKHKVYDVTFQELAKKTGHNLVVVVSNITQRKTEFLSVDTTPELSVITAICASIAIPVIMCPVVINDSYYVDGGLFNNFPIEYFDSTTKPFRDTIGVTIENVQNTSTTQVASGPLNLVSYIKTIVDAMCDRLNYKIPKESNNHIIRIRFADGNPYDYDMTNFTFDAPKEKLAEYETIGYAAAKDQFQVITKVPTIS